MENNKIPGDVPERPSGTRHVRGTEQGDTVMIPVTKRPDSAKPGVTRVPKPTPVPRPTPVTRQMPVSGSGTQRPVQRGTVPRPTPVSRPVPTGTDMNAETRQIPVQRSAPQVSRPAPQSAVRPQTDVGGETRQIPVQRSAPQVSRPAPQSAVRPQTDVGGETRQIPVQRSAPQVSRPAPQSAVRPQTDVGGETRQIPVQRSAQTSRPAPQHSVRPQTDVGGETRQIPVHKPAASDSGEMSATRPVKLKTELNPEVTAKVNPEATVVIKTPAPVAVNGGADDGGTRPMHLPKAEPEKPKKEKASFFSRLQTAGSESGGNTVMSIVKAVVYMVLVLLVSVGISLFIILVGNDVFAFVKTDEEITVTIPEDAGIEDVADILAENGVIKYPGIFKFYASYKNDDGKFLAGTYTVTPATDYEDLLYGFKEHEPEGTSWITIPEGFTTDEIINLLVESGIGTKEKYVDVINNYDFDYWFVDELDATDWKSTGRFYRLDGYLFPDTYEFYNQSSEKTVINKLLARFNVIYGDKYKETATSAGFTTDQVLIIASMIEKEAGMAADYNTVSSVFRNRLASDYYPRLESDATILYAIHHDTGTRPNTCTGEDLKYDSPYNSYLNDGLPPGPIANPSASAINAALTPADTNYYYFVSYEGKTYFASTNEEHEANKAYVNGLREQSAQP